MKIGIFICHCGHNIKGTVDVKHLSEYFMSFPQVVVSVDYPFLCSEPGQDLIREAIAKNKLDRVIIAACTPSLHSELFREILKNSGLNPYMLRRVSIREHCSWTGEDMKGNTLKAKRIIRAGLYSVWHNIPLEEIILEVDRSCLVIGGGISGLSAASFLSKMGINVYVVEREKELGGHLRLLKNVWPSKKSGNEIIESVVSELEKEYVQIFTDTEIEFVEGYFGNYKVTLNARGEKMELKVGGIIVATGFTPFDPTLKPDIPYGKDGRILTSLDFERKTEELDISKSSRVAILHCIGSRDETIGRPYCSRICCINALKLADRVKESYPESYVECFYMDIRAHPRGGEEFYEEVQKKGVVFTRSNIPEVIPTKSGIILRGEDTLTGEVFEREFDLVILSTGMGPPKDNKRISQLLKVSLDKDGFFLEAHVKLRPFDTALKGIFIAGCCSGPKDVEESISHGRAAALKLFGLLNLGYTLAEPYIAFVDEKRCSGCRMCEEVCVAKAIVFDYTRRIAKVNEAQCMGCGLCASTCPSSAIILAGYTDTQISDELSGLLEEIR